MTDYDFLSESELLDVRVQESKAHSELCSVQTYCLNGGTCYLLPSLGRHYCECTENFEGTRCHMKKVSFDYDAMKVNEPINWNTIKPLIVVVGGTLLCVLALFCVYLAISYCCRLCSSRKGKYRLAHSSGSHIALVIEETSSDNGTHVTSTKSRSRLPACSSTPEQSKPFCVQKPATGQHQEQQQQQPVPPSDHRRPNTDAEPVGHNFVDSNRRPHGHRTVDTFEAEIPSTVMDPWTRKIHPENGLVGKGLNLNAPSAVGNHAIGAPCRSPNDTNNNEEVTSDFSVPNNSTVQCVGGRNKRPTHLGHFSDASLTHCNVSSFSESSQDNGLLYDTDPEATAL